MTFAIHTFGCKVNIYESEYVTNLMQANGYQMLDFDSTNNADVYIINTCTVTNEADKKDRKLIHTTRNNHKDSILIVMGCYSQLNPNDIDADIVIGNKYKSEIISLIDEFKASHQKIIKVDNITKTNFEDMYINRFVTHTRAFVKIQDGCNNYCAYCIIPYVRGSIRSKKMEDVLEEVNELVSMGHKEIVLTGINTGAYGKEIGSYDLTDLIEELSKIEGLERIRVSSIEMTEINDKFIKELKNNNKLCGHLQVSLQSCI